MPSLQTSDLRCIFMALDRNGDDHVRVEELSWLLDMVGKSTGGDELERIMGSRPLDFQEFIFFYESLSGGEEVGNDEDEERDLVEAFKVFDRNNDGFISSTELQCVLSGMGLWDETKGGCERMIREFDLDSDGQLDFEEFKRMMSLSIC